MDKRCLDITAVTKLKHGDLWRAACKYGSQAELARFLGVSECELGKWINLNGVPGTRMAPDKRAELDAKLYIATGKGIDEIFPDELRLAREFLKTRKTQERTVTIEVEALLAYAEASRERLQYKDPSKDMDCESLKDAIAEQCRFLSYREREVIKLRYGLTDGHSYTLEEVGHIFKVKRERVRQIEAKAMYKLKSRKSALAGFAETFDCAPAASETLTHDADSGQGTG